MNNQTFIFASDYSGSTHGKQRYHKQADNVLKKFNEEIKSKCEATNIEVIYLVWGAYCNRINAEQLERIYNLEEGRDGNTLPHLIPQWIKENLKDHKNIVLFIVTDGEITPSAITRCCKENENVHYDRVEFYAFDNREIDYSVATAFISNTKTKVVINEDIVGESDTSSDFDYQSIDLQSYDIKIEELIAYIRFKFALVSASDIKTLNEIQKLKELRKRLLKELEDKEKEKGKIQRMSISKGNVEDALLQLENTKFYRMLVSADNSKMKNIDSCVCTLINYLETTKKTFSKNAVEFNKQKFNQMFIATEEEKQLDEDVSFNFKDHEFVEFNDIIYCEDKGIPCLLLKKTEFLQSFILHGDKSNFSKFKSTMDCPLFLLNNYTKRIEEAIEYIYTLESFISINETKISPLSRADVAGAIVPYKEYDDYNDYVLAATYFDGKKVKYNKGLFYYVLYKVLSSLERFEEHFESAIEKFKEYIFYRIEHTKCEMGLSSLPLDPPDIVSLPIALWYCAELSSKKFMNDAALFALERMRLFCGVAKYMKEILLHLDYKIDEVMIDARAELFTYLTILKRINPFREKVYFILSKIFHVEDDFLTMKLENPNNIRLVKYLELDHTKIVPQNLVDSKEKEIDVSKYVYGMYHQKPLGEPKVYAYLSDETSRPCFIILDNDTKYPFYKKLIDESSKICISNKGEAKLERIRRINFSRVVSLNKLYINLTSDLKRYPTFEEFKRYVSSRMKFKDELVRILSVNILSSIESVFNAYEKHNKDKNIDIEKFIQNSSTSINRSNRMEMEKIPLDKINFFLRESSKYLSIGGND